MTMKTMTVVMMTMMILIDGDGNDDDGNGDGVDGDDADDDGGGDGDGEAPSGKRASGQAREASSQRPLGALLLQRGGAAEQQVAQPRCNTVF